MSVVAAVISEAFPFSCMAVLWTEDCRWLTLTRHAKGSEKLELRPGEWLACELDSGGSGVVAVRPCKRPTHASTPAETALQRMPKAQARRLALALRGAPTVHRVRPVSEVPVVRLANWQVSELSLSGARHVWGYDLEAREGRASSLLAEFDPASAFLRSATGLRYELIGPPGFDADGEFVWRTSLSIRGLSAANALSVTDEVWNAIRSGATDVPPPA